jgi:hypothetical protein
LLGVFPPTLRDAVALATMPKDGAKAAKTACGGYAKWMMRSAQYTWSPRRSSRFGASTILPNRIRDSQWPTKNHRLYRLLGHAYVKMMNFHCAGNLKMAQMMGRRIDKLKADITAGDEQDERHHK